MSDGNSNSGGTHHTENHRENDGRSVLIDTGFYEIQVWGDPDDSFDEVADKAKDAADRAKDDVEELDEKYDNGEDVHYS